jgi:predicted RecB family nuclease
MSTQYEISDINYSPDQSPAFLLAPLKRLIGDKAEEYMFMHKAQTYTLERRKIVVFSYKHSTTRNYVNVTPTGTFFKMVNSRHRVGETAFEVISQQEGISSLIDNSIAYYKEGVMLENMRQQQIR